MRTLPCSPLAQNLTDGGRRSLHANAADFLIPLSR
jgi:hypothetical protein